MGADYVGASADLVRHLHALGHRRILYVREPDEAVAATDREQGFLAGLAAVALPAGPDSVVRTDGSDLTVDQLHGWLDSGITAVVAEGTDTLAAARALQATAVAAGLRCPEDFSLALTGEQVYPEPGAQILTGFAVPRRAMGRDAVGLLVKLLEGDTVGDEERQQLLPCSPIQGETSGPPPAGRRRDGLPPDRRAQLPRRRRATRPRGRNRRLRGPLSPSRLSSVPRSSSSGAAWAASRPRSPPAS